MGDERRAIAYALAAVALWSTVATAFELALKDLTPTQLLFIGTVVSTALFWMAMIGRAELGPNWRTLRAASLFGLINPFSYYLVLFEAYDRLPAQIAQPINYTWAIMLAVLAVPVLGQRLSARTLVGILFGYVGVLILLSEGRFDRVPSLDWIGVVLALASTVLWATYWLFNTRVRLEPLPLMAWSFTLATPLIGIVCLIGPGLPDLTGRTLALGIWVGAVEMGVTFLLWQHALRLSSNAGRLGQLIFLSPFVSMIFIANVLGEMIHWTSLVGLGVIVIGLWITRSAKA